MGYYDKQVFKVKWLLCLIGDDKLDNDFWPQHSKRIRCSTFVIASVKPQWDAAIP